MRCDVDRSEIFCLRIGEQFLRRAYAVASLTQGARIHLPRGISVA